MVKISRVTGVDWRMQLLSNLYGVSCRDLPYLFKVEEGLHAFIDACNKYGKLSNEQKKSFSYLLSYYEDGMEIEDISESNVISKKLVRSRIANASVLLIKYWWTSPKVPIDVNEFNKLVIMSTGDMEFLDSLKQYGISRLNYCLRSDGSLWSRVFDCIPYVHEDSLVRLMDAIRLRDIFISQPRYREFGDLWYQARVRRDVTLWNILSYIGPCEEYIKDLEGGRILPEPTFITELCKAYTITTREILPSYIPLQYNIQKAGRHKLEDFLICMSIMMCMKESEFMELIDAPAIFGMLTDNSLKDMCLKLVGCFGMDNDTIDLLISNSESITDDDIVKTVVTCGEFYKSEGIKL